jgi:hypothetical protein
MIIALTRKAGKRASRLPIHERIPGDMEGKPALPA